MNWGFLYNTVLLACCFYCGIFGRTPERIAVALIALASLLTGLVQAVSGEGHADFGLWVLIIDISMLVALVTLALIADRFWPLWAAGFHLAGIATHMAVNSERLLDFRAYAHGAAFWSYAVIAAVMLGTWFEVRRTGSRVRHSEFG